MATLGDKDVQMSVPRTLDVLGEHLHAKICQLSPDLSLNSVNNVTGILLECGTKEVLSMLENCEKLTDRVSKVLQHFQDKWKEEKYKDYDSTEEACDEKNQIADDLFEKVARLEPGLCAQITGMLLELDIDILKHVYHSDEKLRLAISKAKRSYLASLKTSDSLEELGELVYERVEGWYPNVAAQITGMLLEMDWRMLKKIICKPTELKMKADQAFHVYRNHQQS